MTILNQDLAWSSLGDDIHAAFKGAPEKVELRAGMKLYKFNGYATLTPPGAAETAVITGWWSPYQAFKWDAGLENRRKTAAAMGGASLKELSRIVVAVREDWSSLDYLATTDLKKPVYAFFGTVAPQARIGAGAASKRSGDERQSIGGGKLVGSGGQFYIPGLTLAHLENVDVKKLD